MPGELELAKFFVDFLSKVFGLRKDQKTDIADYLDKIAAKLSEFGPAFREKNLERMSSLSTETGTLAKDFSKVTQGILGPEKILDLASKLATAAHDKQMLTEISQGKAPPEEVTRLLLEIAQASGLFSGVSMSLKAEANRF